MGGLLANILSGAPYRRTNKCGNNLIEKGDSVVLGLSFMLSQSALTALDGTGI